MAGGANIVCFTTWRGSTYGCRLDPSIKLATNSKLYGRAEFVPWQIGAGMGDPITRLETTCVTCHIFDDR
ncbi:hypothetical protein BJF92_18035 [Rhizobium rhizosphaerae]|uniref:D-galactarate/Altronate dehydratase C-terminal domain-containing protein n=1 Tax=Xaviernesmea rhizosphaerae TaxID=1672749 RepID=A0A1Q9ADF3_9HYPH|nr:hypothetical protein BJF92_18035 [Xaviernesmea rhizosphaerae]